ncbi:MAG TPA: type I secretion system permease/ATPase [Afifellaceae bacterium]|nr:type I secretion system permease/ATPase [Afifellaceae bacterium]
MPKQPVTNALQEALSRCRGGLLAVFGFSMVINLLMLTVPLYMLQIFDRVLASESGETLLYLTMLVAALLAVLGIFELLRSRVLVRLGIWVDQLLGPSVFLRGLESTLRGAAYRTEALRDLATFRGFLGGGGIMALFDSPWVPVYILVIYLLHPTLGHIALFGAVALFSMALLTELATGRGLKEANAHAARSMRGAESAYRNAEVADGMGMGETLARRWHGANAEVLELQALVSDRAGTITSFTKFLRLLLQMGVLGAGAWLVLKHELTPGGMIAASIILGRALAPVEQAIGTWKQTSAAREAWQRLSDLFAQKPLHPATMELPRPKGHLSIESVTYGAPGTRLPILKGLSLQVKPGEAMAIIGPSGSGKSTLARLMVGIGQPQVGSVRLDGAEIYTLDRGMFGRHIGYLPQDVELFSGTVRENIARMEEGAPEKIVAAAEMAGLHQIILRLPSGYDTEIGEHGAFLSGGQRQRIALARALYDDPVLLVLDEPNANLDGAGEEALNQALAAAKAKGMAIVLIAHRPAMLTHVDQVAVLSDGQLQAVGPRDAVLSQLHQRAAAAQQGQPPVRVVSAAT